MLDNAARLPPEPVDDLANAAGPVVQPAHGVLEACAQHRDLRRRPDGPQDVEGRAGPVAGREGVVILLSAPVFLVSAQLSLSHTHTCPRLGPMTRPPRAWLKGTAEPSAALVCCAGEPDGVEAFPEPDTAGRVAC